MGSGPHGTGEAGHKKFQNCLKPFFCKVMPQAFAASIPPFPIKMHRTDMIDIARQVCQGGGVVGSKQTRHPTNGIPCEPENPNKRPPVAHPHGTFAGRVCTACPTHPRYQDTQAGGHIGSQESRTWNSWHGSHFLLVRASWLFRNRFILASLRKTENDHNGIM